MGVVAASSPAQTPLLLPTTVVFDASGNLFVAETNRHVVDRIDALGVVTVVAGNGTQGFSGDAGPATAAQLDSPQGLAVDAAGNLYIADTHNHRVRMIVAGNGTITTIAGAGPSGFSGDQSQGVFARLSLPTALALDNSGNLDIADSNNHRIRQLNLSTGIIRTIAGNGTQADAGEGAAALSASIDTPTGLAVNASNDVYLADAHNHRIRRIDHATGIITTVAGGGTGSPGAATAAKLRLPRGLSFDAAGNLYLADTQAHHILRIAVNGTLSTVAGEGTQGFAGDNGPAVAALLDSPRSPAVSPAGLLTIADTGNRRVRQLDTGALIRTFSGGGTLSPGAILTLAAPATIPYGTGTVTASFDSSTIATGGITFFEISNHLANSLETVALASNTATFSTAHLSAGSHQLQAAYAGDATHPSLQSAVLPVTVTPAPVSVTADAASVVYGQAVPLLTGSISGVLPQDASLVSAAFSTAAKALSPVARYPISATLTGASAKNYQIVTFTPGFLVIGQASTATALSTSASTLAQGTAITFSARAVSTTQGVPTGRIVFSDNTAVIGSSPVDATGTGVLSASLDPGAHSVTAVYSGDTNFLSSSSGTVSTVVSTSPGLSPDFTLSPSGAASQTASLGASVAYPFRVTVVNGPLNSPILLTAAGMPAGASVTFDPSIVPPGSSAATFTLTIQTAKGNAGLSSRSSSALPMVLCALLAVPMGLRRKGFRGRKLFAFVPMVLALVCLGCLAGCGTNIATLPQTAAKSTTYPVTVTATATSPSGSTLQHTASISLTLQ